MSYNIGQFRSFDIDINEYLNQQVINIEEYETHTIDNIIFHDRYAQVNLNTLNNYYLNFNVLRLDSNQTIYLKAANNNREQLLGTFKIPQKTTAEEEKQNFELVFSVNDSYNQIIWQLVRTVREDYTEITINTDQVPGRKMTIDASLYIVTDLLANASVDNNISQGAIKQKFSNLQYLNKIGIQGPPLMLMSINRQQIRIGKNGIYELNNGINVTSIGFVPKQYECKDKDGNVIKDENNNVVTKKDFFIMDFEYQATDSIEQNNDDEQEGE